MNWLLIPGLVLVIALLQAAVMWLLEGVALRVKQRPAPAPSVPWQQEPGFWLLSHDDMQLLLVNAGRMALQNRQEDGTGLVKADVLGWSWRISRPQMGAFLAWVRGKTVHADDAIWMATVAERRTEGTAWIVFERQSDVVPMWWRDKGVNVKEAVRRTVDELSRTYTGGQS